MKRNHGGGQGPKLGSRATGKKLLTECSTRKVLVEGPGGKRELELGVDVNILFKWIFKDRI
jgi:hypothetical protein